MVTKDDGPDAGVYDPSRFREGQGLQIDPKRSHWDDIPGHPLEDWKNEVKEGDTRAGYEEWAAARIEQAKNEGHIFCLECGNAYSPDEECDSAHCENIRENTCRTCGEVYEPNGDGYDGECPSCADKTDKELHPEDYEEE